ncbi:site-specific integrase [Aeromonas salmonicida]|uniref:site-specific integrase n=1 Tax=Aeromonas salmonicida TaxID=645 RepID=UPI003D06E081
MNTERIAHAHEAPRRTKSGYVFYPDAPTWVLSKDMVVNVQATRERLSADHRPIFTQVLSHFACHYSAAHTANLCENVGFYCRYQPHAGFSVTDLINYRSQLGPHQSHMLSLLRIFLKKWHALGYPGIAPETCDLLAQWSFKAPQQGAAVRSRDPTKGPFTDIELQAFNEAAVACYERGEIALYDLAFTLLLSHTGRRVIQLSHLCVGDLYEGHDHAQGPLFFVNIPRAKLPGADFRTHFKAFAISAPLWQVMQRQAQTVIATVSQQITGAPLPATTLAALPLFPEWSAMRTTQRAVLEAGLHTDVFHMKNHRVRAMLQRICVGGALVSERTGLPLVVSARRFRYTKGTRAAREGFGTLVIAELLDHSDTQSAAVYVKSTPELAGRLEASVGTLLQPYANAFQGVIIDTLHDGGTSEPPPYRVRFQGRDNGDCASRGTCHANVPVPCYTCMHFQPWRHGPHRAVHAWLTAQRAEVLASTGDEVMASINDRAIMAVAQVIALCDPQAQAGQGEQEAQ